MSTRCHDETALKKLIFLLFLTFVPSGSALASRRVKPEPVILPEDFMSDGCSVFPDSSYRECCVEHDKTYYVGGSWRKRLQADDKLFMCVAHTKGIEPKIAAPLMWIGVRVAGPSYIWTPFRWGFGKKDQKK